MLILPLENYYKRHNGTVIGIPKLDQGFGLLGCCAITFLIMFVPKSRQLSAIGKEGIYLEDQVL